MDADQALTEGLSALVYVSHAKNKVDIDVLQEITLQSLKNNNRDCITGVLFYHDKTYFQYLEGEPGKLANVVQRIRTDKRHGGFTMLWTDNIYRRVFPDWSMALFEVPKSDFLEIINAKWWDQSYPTIEKLQVPIGIGVIRRLCALSQRFSIPTT